MDTNNRDLNSLGVSMGDAGAIMNMTRGLSGNVADSTGGLGNSIMQLLQSYQQYGTNTANAAMQSQAGRIMQTNPSLIGASPSVQSATRNASAQALQPTIGGAQSLVSNVNSAISNVQNYLKTVEDQKNKARDDARAVIHDIITNYSAADIRKALSTNPDQFNDLLKQSGYPKDFLASSATYKEQTEALKGGVTTGSGVGTVGSPEIDSSLPGYSTAMVGDTGLTQAAIDQAAMQYATTGVMPSVGLGSTGQAGNKRNAIENRAAELAQGTTIATAKASLQANQMALTEQTKAMNSVQSALTAADQNFQQVIDSFNGSGLNPTNSTIANRTLAWLRQHLTGGNQFAFDAGIQEVKNDYAIVFSRGGAVTDQARSQADSAINDKISFSDLQKVHTELQSLAQQIVASRTKQIKQIQDQISNPFGNKSGASSPTDTSGIKQEVQQIKDNKASYKFKTREDVENALVEQGVDKKTAHSIVFSVIPDNTPGW
jgi:hypothetical protein